MMRLVAFGMSSGWQHVLVRQWFRETFGAEEGAAWTDTCEGDGPPHSPFTADPAMSAAFQKLRPADLAWASGPDELPKGQGSNWVVVAGKHTTSGKPMLANDPHFPKPGRRAIERIEAMRESGTKFPDLSDIDEDFEPDDDEDDDKE